MDLDKKQLLSEFLQKPEKPLGLAKTVDITRKIHTAIKLLGYGLCQSSTPNHQRKQYKSHNLKTLNIGIIKYIYDKSYE